VTATPSAGVACTGKNGTGLARANVANIVVACTRLSAYTIGGTVSGLDAGKSVVLVNSSADNLTVSANGAFTFATPVWSGTTYVVAVATQPPAQYCEVTGGSTGTASANVTDVSVSCHDPFTVGGTVSGLVGQGLQIALDTTTLDISANGSYVFPTSVMPSHAGHAVTVSVQPHSPAQHCIVQDPYFTYSVAPAITDVNIVCGEFAYVADAAANSITPYAIDPLTGALGAPGAPVATGQSPIALAVARDKQYLYASDNAGNSISAYTVDAGDSGALTAVPGSPFATGKGPGAIAVKSETWCTQPGRGGHRCLIAPVLFVANGGAGTVTTYAVDQSSGVLSGANSASLPSGPNPIALATGDDDLFMYVADAASGQIYAYKSTSGELIVADSPLASHGKLASLANGLGQQFLYAANASGATGSILGYRIRQFVAGSRVMPGGLTATTPYALANCSTVASDRDRGYLYATAGTNLYGFGIDPATGALALLPGFPVAVGLAGDAIEIDPSNQFLYVVASKAGKVAGYRVDAVTGSLVAPIPGSPFAVGGSSIAFATL